MAKQAAQPARHRRAMRDLHADRRMLLPLAIAIASCSSGPSDAARMRALIDPYLDDVAQYDRWARRLDLADSAFRSRGALEEAAFAPLRRNRRVAAAWIEREGPDAGRLSHPPDAPALPEGGWVRVRTEDLGDLEARRATLRIEGEEHACLLVKRSAPATGAATLHVTLAFYAR